jgi:DNA-binding NtrC family response regulator
MDVLLLDDDNDLRDIMSVLLTDLGHECLALSSYDQLVALGERPLRCRLAVIDINLGEGNESGIDAFRWLRAHRFSGTMCFLTGHALSHPLVKEAVRLGEVDVLQKPITLEELTSLVARSQAAR